MEEGEIRPSGRFLQSQQWNQLMMYLKQFKYEPAVHVVVRDDGRMQAWQPPSTGMIYGFCHVLMAISDDRLEFFSSALNYLFHQLVGADSDRLELALHMGLSDGEIGEFLALREMNADDTPQCSPLKHPQALLFEVSTYDDSAGRRLRKLEQLCTQYPAGLPPTLVFSRQDTHAAILVARMDELKSIQSSINFVLLNDQPDLCLFLLHIHEALKKVLTNMRWSLTK